MDFSLSEEQRAFQELARDFAREQLLPEAAAWDEEIMRRITELDVGRLESVPAEEVFAEARARLRAPPGGAEPTESRSALAERSGTGSECLRGPFRPYGR